MAGEMGVAEFSGLFKDQFHSELNEVIPDHVVLQKDDFISWVPSDKMNGEFYSVPTVLRSNQGVSYLGESGAVTDLEAAVAGLMKEAQVKGSEINVRGQLGYKALSQAASAGGRAFKKAVAWLVEDLAQVAYTRLEIAALYGQTGLGTVESATDLGSNLANIVITEETFAPGIWVGAEGAKLDSFTGTTKNNGSGALTINLVTVSSRTIKVTYAGTLATECAAGDVLFFKGSNSGSSSFTEMVGLYKQFSATTGTLFNIDKSAYTLIQGNVKSSTGALTKAKVIDAAMLTVDKGCMADLVCLVSTKGWAKLLAEDMALRVFDSSYSPAKSESGSKELVYDKVGGKITVVCHPMVKYGEAFLFNKEDVIWVGSAKPTFEIPGMPEKFFRLVSDKNAVELQNYADVAIYALKPSQTALMTGITYS